MLKNKNNQQRNYFYDKIPLSLKETDNELIRFISYFSTQTLYKIEKLNKDYYVAISREKGRALFRDDYYKHLKYCLEKGILQEKVYGVNKQNQETITYSKEAGLSKAYKLNDNLIQELEKGQYSRRVISAPKYFKKKNKEILKIMITKKPHELTDYDKEIIEKVYKNYTEINVEISEDWDEMFSAASDDTNYYEYCELLEIIKKIDKGEFNVSIGKNNGRVYSPMIVMDKRFRKYILFNGKPLYNIDMSSFHPFLLSCFLEDETKKQEYIDFLKNNDIYEYFSDEKYSRSDIKILFQIFLGSFRYKGKLRDIYKWYKKNYPEILRKKILIKKAKSSVQLELQKIESEIFVNNVFKKTRNWMIPAHDGVFVLEDDIQQTKDLIKKELENFLKFSVTLKVEKV